VDLQIRFSNEGYGMAPPFTPANSFTFDDGSAMGKIHESRFL